jgi:hypothetical protein
MVNKTLMINYAILIILVVNSMNLFGKWIYSFWKGNKIFSKFNFILFLSVSIVSFVWYLYII